MNSDLILVIDRRNTVVTLKGGALCIERPESKRQVPLGLLGQVVIHGNPQVGCEVWRELAQRNIPTVLQSLRGGERSACLASTLGSSIAVRVAQHRLAAAGGIDLGRTLVMAKVQGYLSLLQTLPQSEASCEQLRARLASLPQAQKVTSLMGIEGAASVTWWSWLRVNLPEQWMFSGRNRRPPKDPLNALLSLGYTLLESEVLAEVQRQGFDPALGFLHGIVPGRTSLVFDLMEPLRPGVDAFALSLLERALQPSHFSRTAESGCRLNKEGRAIFYQAWAEVRALWPLLPFGMERQEERVTLMQCCHFVAGTLREALGHYAASDGSVVNG